MGWCRESARAHAMLLSSLHIYLCVSVCVCTYKYVCVCVSVCIRLYVIYMYVYVYAAVSCPAVQDPIGIFVGKDWEGLAKRNAVFCISAPQGAAAQTHAQMARMACMWARWVWNEADSRVCVVCGLELWSPGESGVQFVMVFGQYLISCPEDNSKWMITWLWSWLY
jgi:hypothetical protein